MAAAFPRPNHLLGHYRVLEKIGAGGMGEVYLARDEELNRDAAIKVLPARTLADPSAARRVRREARALARLSDRHVAGVYELGRQDGIDYIALEYVGGMSLRAKIEGRRLAEPEVLDLGLQLALGLAAAHGAGVIHGDIKPENARVTPEGILKIVDFGLARSLSPESQSSVETTTAAAAVAGTLPYMSPEQLRGSPADVRSDIYAAGTTLYEMAAGRLPFASENSLQLMDAIQRQPPVSPRALGRISTGLESVILKSLEKDPQRRYQSARELAIDLQRLSAPQAVLTRRPAKWNSFRTRRVGVLGVAAVLIVVVGLHYLRPRARVAAPDSHPRIAVLPFENLGPQNREDYLGMGIADEVSTLLSRVRRLQVISRMSMGRFQPAAMPPPQTIAKELHVRYLVRGSIQHAEQQVRIVVALLDAPSGTQLWARHYDRPEKNLLDVENEVAVDVAQSLASTLGAEEYSAVATPLTQNPQAFDEYLRGKTLTVQFNNRGREEDFTAAEQALKDATAADAGMAGAYGELAHLYFLHDVDRARPSVDAERARTVAQHALDLDPHQLAALDALGMMYSVQGDDSGAYRSAIRAIQINAHDSGALMVLGVTYANMGML
ncbi:MAG: protein kinase, partial [Acidobacteria bacterium]|nr:protein kinase [Acidobacteriota bacterium]